MGSHLFYLLLTSLTCVFSQLPKCLNEGVQNAESKCDSASGYEGFRCERKSCVHGIKIGFTCSCNRGWEGEFCDVETVCDHGTILHDNCTCNRGYKKGTICDQVICENGKPGTDNYNTDVCYCDLNWMGTFCEELDCNNNGKMVLHHEHDGKRCNCFTGWSGDLCDEIKEESTSSGTINLSVLVVVAVILIVTITSCIICCLVCWVVRKCKSQPGHTRTYLETNTAPHCSATHTPVRYSASGCHIEQMETPADTPESPMITDTLVPRIEPSEPSGQELELEEETPPPNYEETPPPNYEEIQPPTYQEAVEEYAV